MTAEPVHVGRRQNSQVVAANYACERRRGIRDDTLRKCNGVTREGPYLTSFPCSMESLKPSPIRQSRSERGVRSESEQLIVAIIDGTT